ncbi:MAG: Bacterial regulatory protein luxR family [Cyanobacteriota bacterium]|jgi:hypothetical protein
MIKVEIPKTNNPKPSDNLIFPKIKFKGHLLTERQIRILELIGEGYSNSDIAKILVTSNRSVDGYIYDIRNLISRELGYRLGERQLVLFAREMLDGYVTFMRLKTDHSLSAYLNNFGYNKPDQLKDSQCIRLGHTNFIEDWDNYPDDDDIDDVDDEELDAIFPKDGSYRSLDEDLEISNFKIEKIVFAETNNKFFMV